MIRGARELNLSEGKNKRVNILFDFFKIRTHLSFHLNLHCQCNIIITSKVRSTYLMSFDIKVTYPELRSQLNVGKFIPHRV